jgi:hypothetical protein
VSNLTSSNDPLQSASPIGPAAPEILWYCRIFGTEFGPLPLDTLCEMIRTGQLGPMDQIRSSDACYWQAARQVSVLDSVLSEVDSNDYLGQSQKQADSSSPTMPVSSDAHRNNPDQDGRSSASPAAGSDEVACAGNKSRVRPPDRWFYRLDGREHGPFRLAELQELIGPSGQTAGQVVVRRDGGNEWIGFYDVAVNSTWARQGLPRESLKEQVATAGEVSDGWRTVQEHATRVSPRTRQPPSKYGRELLIGLLLWALLNVGVLVAWSDRFATERGYYATLRSLEHEVHGLQSRHATSEEWRALRAKTKETLAPIVADLKRTASPSRSIRQHLLWAARDQFPRLVEPTSADTCKLPGLYEYHMHLIEQSLGEL